MIPESGGSSGGAILSLLSCYNLAVLGVISPLMFGPYKQNSKVIHFQKSKETHHWNIQFLVTWGGGAERCPGPNNHPGQIKKGESQKVGN